MKNEESINTNECQGHAISIKCMSEKLQGIPEPPKIFRGIIRPSVGCFFGPSKTGKTTLAENLALSIAAGLDEFLGEPIECSNRRVLFVNMEEYYRSRTLRNQRQITAITNKYGLDQTWQENVFVVDEEFPRYMLTDDHWKLLDKEIEKVQPGIVVMDSVTRTTMDSIEDSSVSTKLMKRFREVAHKHNIALIFIHHSQKMDNRPITISSLAGSRVIGQEMDFMIGINRTSLNVRYMKDVAYRYHPDDSEFVLKFEIDFNQLINPVGEAHESDVISAATNHSPALNDNDSIVQEMILELTGGDESIIIQAAELYEKIVNTGILSRPTLHASLKRLENNGLILKPEKGTYRINNPS